MNDSARMPIPSLSSLRIGTLLPLQGTFHDVLSFIELLNEYGGDICELMKLCTARRCYFDKDEDNQVDAEMVKQKWTSFFRDSEGVFGDLINATTHDNLSTKQLYYKAIQCCEVSSFVKNPTLEKMKSLAEFELQNDQVRNRMVRAPLRAKNVPEDVREAVFMGCMHVINVTAEKQKSTWNLSLLRPKRVIFHFFHTKEQALGVNGREPMVAAVKLALKLCMASSFSAKYKQWIIGKEILTKMSIFKFEIQLILHAPTDVLISVDDFLSKRFDFFYLIESVLRTRQQLSSFVQTVSF
tara:strand:- start:177 stop:1067 length:891 start_codon:yes stop_codon:yes gene_type:complete